MDSNLSGRGEVLVALLKTKADLSLVQDEGWYRIPVNSAPKAWPPQRLAFYQPKAFDQDAYRIRYYGAVSDINVVSRRELFPNEIESARSEKLYYRLQIKDLLELKKPIPSVRPRRLVFIPTTWKKFVLAEQINDLFADSPLEDRLWEEFRDLSLNAERQWAVIMKQQFYQLDFALFCNDGKIDIETDGDTWHAHTERIPQDNLRNNDLEADGWHVLRFNGQQIREQMKTYCLGNITKTIENLGGETDEGLIPRKFFYEQGNVIQQLSLFEERSAYHIDEASYPEDID